MTLLVGDQKKVVKFFTGGGIETNPKNLRGNPFLDPCPGIILSYPILLSILANIPNLASVISILFLVPKIDAIGRKGTALHLKSCLGLLASIVFIFSKLFLSIELFILGSFLLGLIDAIRNAAVKIYIAECAPSCYRGMLNEKRIIIGAQY